MTPRHQFRQCHTVYSKLMQLLQHNIIYTHSIIMITVYIVRSYEIADADDQESTCEMHITIKVISV